jgi:hypothetical protein
MRRLSKLGVASNSPCVEVHCKALLFLSHYSATRCQQNPRRGEQFFRRLLGRHTVDAGASDAEALGIGRHTKSPSKTTPGFTVAHCALTDIRKVKCSRRCAPRPVQVYPRGPMHRHKLNSDVATAIAGSPRSVRLDGVKDSLRSNSESGSSSDVRQGRGGAHLSPLAPTGVLKAICAWPPNGGRFIPGSQARSRYRTKHCATTSAIEVSATCSTYAAPKSQRGGE